MLFRRLWAYRLGDRSASAGRSIESSSELGSGSGLLCRLLLDARIERHERFAADLRRLGSLRQALVRHRSVVLAGVAAVMLGSGPLAVARQGDVVEPTKETKAKPKRSKPNAAVVATPRSGALAFASAPLRVGPGRPCTPRRQAIQALGDAEEGSETEPTPVVESLIAGEPEPGFETFAALAPLPPGGFGLPGGFGPPGSGPPTGPGPSLGPGPGGPGGPIGPGGPGELQPPPVIPEPGTWTLLIVGFGAVGAALRRRAGRPAKA